MFVERYESPQSYKFKTKRKKELINNKNKKK